MGHQKVETTMIYIHALGNNKIQSPMDRLPILRREVIES
jgi:hypothetical protein